MTLRTLLAWLCLCAGLALRSTPAYAQAADTAPSPDAHGPLAGRLFDTQVGLRIEPPAIPDQNAWTWHRLRVRAEEAAPSLSGVIPQIVAHTRTYTPVAADVGAYLAVCYAATADTLPRHCSDFHGPVKPAIPAANIAGLRWSEGSGLTDPHSPLAVHDEIQIRGGASGTAARGQPFGTWWQRSTSNPAQPDDIETFVYLSDPDQWANPDVQALPADPGLSRNRRYLTPDDVGRYVRGCWWRRRDATWHCTSWFGPVVATVHLPDEYRMEIVGVPSHIDVRGGTPVTWWRRPAADNSRAPTQVAASANPYTPADDDAGHFLRACHAVGADRACTQWLGPVLPAIPTAHRGDYPQVGTPAPVYFDRPAQRPTAYRVGDHLRIHAPDTLQPIPLAPHGHVSQPVWMGLVGVGTPQWHDRVLHVGPDFVLPGQYHSFRVCLYGAHGATRGWGCSSRVPIQQ